MNTKITLRTLYLLFTAMFLLSACNTTSGLNEISTKPTSEPVIIGNTYKIQSSIFEKERRLTVRLPAGYDKAGDKNFPVMFVVDGGPEQDFPHLAGMLQSVDINYTLEPFILVGIETEERSYEISPPSDESTYDEAFPKRGGSNEFRKYIREDVIPWVKTNYRVNEDFGLIGESLAGLFVIETFLKDSNLFSKYAAISPSMWWDKQSLSNASSKYLYKLDEKPKKLYLSMGNEGWNMQAGLDTFIKALQEVKPSNVTWSYVDRRNSEDHGSIYHPAALDAFRTFYSTPYRTGASSRSFYLFPNGEAPPLSKKAKENLDKECTKENAIKTTFEETNANWAEWNGVCVLMKPGDKPTLWN